ncbi:auxin-binding protein ABP19b-like [Vicia villosa]|uniref:auxin-binding protein ABP19b-like n=1 Tax=Vicia villosa TaxID=3911 RepID=UPI00273C1C8E|nr:auxin-binding protein ABP19b-like [Vicia villosa]
MKTILIILLFLALFSYTSNANSFTNDFCVANLGLPKTPSGYPCKSETIVTANDFVSSGFVAGSIKSPFNIGFTPVNVKNLPGLNGLGISVARIDYAINGSVPMHIHPDATELAIIVEGVVDVGFITPTNVYQKTLKAGDVFVFPIGLLHFSVNSGPGKAIVFSAFSSDNPSLQILDVLIFGNRLANETIEKTTLLEKAQIMKLKAQFGGSG